SAEEKLKAEIEERTKAEEKARFYVEELTEAKERLKAEIEARLRAEKHVQHEAAPIEIRSFPVKNINCECCGKDGFSEEELVRIDSGHLFCPECLKELRS
ncbi:MAG: RING finger protein, partial [Planctomycetota bacterium]